MVEGSKCLAPGLFLCWIPLVNEATINLKPLKNITIKKKHRDAKTEFYVQANKLHFPIEYYSFFLHKVLYSHRGFLNFNI